MADFKKSSEYVELNTDLVKNIKDFDPTTMVDHATVISTARRRSGKSYSLKRIIEANKDKYDSIFLFSGTIDFPANRKEYSFIPEENMYNYLDEDVIRDLLNKQLEILRFNEVRPEKEKIRSNICIILDDILTDAVFRKPNNIVSELFVQGRHSHIALFVLVQTFSGREGIGPCLRKNADYIISFYQHNVNDRKAMSEQFLSVVDTKLGSEYFKAITNEPHQAIIIDVNNTGARTYEDYIYKYLAPETCKDFFIGSDEQKDGCVMIKMPKENEVKKLKVKQQTKITKTAKPKRKNKFSISVRTTIDTDPAYNL